MHASRLEADLLNLRDTFSAIAEHLPAFILLDWLWQVVILSRLVSRPKCWPRLHIFSLI